MTIKTEQTIIYIVGISLAFLAVFKSLSIEAERIEKENNRRSEMYTTLEDEPR